MWAYAVMASVYIRNRCFNSRLGKTPYEALIGKQPNLRNMHVFGSKCYAFVQNVRKLDARSQKGIFVGYDKESPAYLVFYPNMNKVEKVRCVKFMDNFETEHLPEIDDLISNSGSTENVAKKPEISSTPDYNIEQQSNSETIDRKQAAESNETQDRYPTRSRSHPDYFGQSQRKTDDSLNYALDYCYRLEDIPVCYKQAVNASDANKWQEAMNKEMKALIENETFELVPRPKDRQTVGARWVYAVKTNQNGDETYKARFVAKGYSQIEDIDYKETFAPNSTYDVRAHFITTHSPGRHDSPPDGR